MTPKNILLTGGVSSVGGALAEHLRSQSHRVYTVGPGKGHTYDHYCANFVPCEAYELEGEVSNVFNSWLGQKRIDVLINNAGIISHNWIEEESIDAVSDVMDVNFLAPWLFTREMARQAVQYPSHVARIVNILSMGVKLGLRTASAYISSKCALEGFTRQIAKEFAGRHKISVYGLAPGVMNNTGIQVQGIRSLIDLRGMSKEDAERTSVMSPLGRNMTYDEFIPMANFLVNDAPEYMTGSVIYASGGMGI